MKKILIILLTLSFVCLVGLFIRFNSNDSVEINGKKFILKYSNCEKDSVVCMNEYFLEDEYDMQWTELYTVVYGPKNNDPIKTAYTLISRQKFAEDLLVNYEKNSAIAVFGILFNKENGEVAVEQNVSKVSMYEHGDGVLIQQYARRYDLDVNQYDKTVNNMKNFNAEYTLIIDKIPQQKMYMKPLQKW